MSEPANAVTVISETRDLQEVCKRLSSGPYVAVDTEFMRENTFWAQLCLIQVAGPEEAVVIDPLSADIELDAFFELMSDQSVMKIFHAARQDVEIFVKLSGAVPAPLFDTQIAAMVSGFGDQVSYDQLVRRITGTGIDKTSRFTDWSRRPLTVRQLAYALSDVTHLRDVYTFLDANLHEQNRSHWVAEEMAIVSDPETYRSHPENAWRRLKMRVRKPRQLAVMMAVAAWRETEAQERNLPRNRIMKDDAIYEIALQQPRDREALARLRTIPKGFERSAAGAAILAAVNAAMELPVAELPNLPRPRSAPEHASAVAELLKVLLKHVAEREGVAARIIATTDELEQIAADDNADVAAMRGWRRELFGELALAVKRGDLALAMSAGGVTTVPRRHFAAAAE